MKWFKHYTCSSDDEFIAGLEEEFGLEGYARWWKLLEAIAKQMDKTDRCFAEYSWNKWQTFLKAKRKKLETFLEYSENKLKINVEQNENILRISCPKLLQIRDNHTKNLQVADKSLASKSKNKNKNKNKKTSSADKATAQFILNWRKSLHPNHKDPDLDGWAESVRLMREVDKRLDKDIREFYSWVMKDEFWFKVCLSPDGLRKHWDKIEAKRKEPVKKKSTVRHNLDLLKTIDLEVSNGNDRAGVPNGNGSFDHERVAESGGRPDESMVPAIEPKAEDW